MTIKKGGLGPRNLSVLLSANSQSANSASTGDLRLLPLAMLQPGLCQPRKDIQSEALEELANSIRAQGVIQPIIVRLIKDNKYEIIAGERRWRAAKLAGLNEIPAIIRNIADENTMAIALIENIQREDLNAIEEALALKRLLQEFAMTHEQVAAGIGKSRTSITNLLRLLDLEPEVQGLLERAEISKGHAKVLLALTGSQQITVAKRIVAKGLSVRDSEVFIHKMQLSAPKLKKLANGSKDKLLKWQRDLTQQLGHPIVIKSKDDQSGQLSISYKTIDELQKLVNSLMILKPK